MKEIRKILVPTDLSAGSLAGLEYGITLAKLYGSKLYILNVMDNRPYDELTRACSLMDELYNSLEKNIRLELNRYVGSAFCGDIDEVLNLVRCGIPEKEIVLFAESERIDLIVMTDKTIIYGSDKETLTKKVMRLTDIPVVTIKPGFYGEKKTNLSFFSRDYNGYNFRENYSNLVR